MKKSKMLIIIVIIAILMSGLMVGYYFLFMKKELDDVAKNGPIQSEIIQKMDQSPLFKDILAAGISWDYDEDRFFVSTDHPQRLFAQKIASFHVINSTLDKKIYQKDFETDGDLEGIAYIGNGEVAAMSETGTLYYLKEIDGEWQETKQVSIFTDSSVPHKLGSLAYDVVNKQLYSAEKEGKKVIYLISRDGELLDTFDLNVDNFGSTREFSIDSDYTISGMAFDEQHLYIFSEAYSTIFVYDPATATSTAVYGIHDIHESAGMTIKNGIVYLVGDAEAYLPPPSFYKVKIPQ